MSACDMESKCLLAATTAKQLNTVTLHERMNLRLPMKDFECLMNSAVRNLILCKRIRLISKYSLLSEI